MKKNMGSIDRYLRAALAIVFAILIFLGTVEGVAAVILGVLAAILLVTSVLGFCPIYAPLHWSTLTKKTPGA
jgi:hypothetical protein